jgi:hypothetical protein
LPGGQGGSAATRLCQRCLREPAPQALARTTSEPTRKGLRPVPVKGCVSSLDHLISGDEECWRDRDAECLGGLEIDYQIELGG